MNKCLTALLGLISLAHLSGQSDCDNATILSGEKPEIITNFTYGGQWYKFTPAATGYYVISTCGLCDCDTKLNLYTSCNANDIVQWSDDNCGLQSSMTRKLEANVPVWIWISDANSSCTGKKVELSCTYLGQTEVSTSIERPTANDIRALCSSVSSKMSNKPAPPKYYYESLLFEMSGTNNNDPDKIKKVRDFWNKHHHKFICKKSTDSMEEGGYIAKLPIAEPFDPFIVDLTTVYKVDVNAITNGTTVLDYIDIKRKEYANNPLMLDELDRWYDLFEEAGGKHARDLK